jgi:hypothetical protein
MAKRNLKFQKNNFHVSRDRRYRAWVWAREQKHCSRISINKVSKVHLNLINICEIFHLLTVNGNNKNKFSFQMMLIGIFGNFQLWKKFEFFELGIQCQSCWSIFFKDRVFDRLFLLLFVYFMALHALCYDFVLIKLYKNGFTIFGNFSMDFWTFFFVYILIFKDFNKI